jgi:hypothetical protein
VLCADIDAFDLEVACDDPVKLVDLLVALEPTFGGINLEDIKVGGNQQPHQAVDNLLSCCTGRVHGHHWCTMLLSLLSVPRQHRGELLAQSACIGLCSPACQVA